jgi:hypothetical protein
MGSFLALNYYYYMPRRLYLQIFLLTKWFSQRADDTFYIETIKNSKGNMNHLQDCATITAGTNYLVLTFERSCL